MAFNGSGTFIRLYSWVTDRNNAVKILADRHDAEDDGFATGLSNCITKDGQSTPTANIPLGGFKLTNVGDATNATDAVNRQTGDARYHPIGATTTTDEAIARYNGTAGALQNSTATLDDTGNLTAATLKAQSTDAGASDFSAIIVDRFSASPAVSDVLGSLVFRGRDDGGNSTDYGSIRGVILDKTDATEDGQIILRTLVGGSATSIMTWGPGVQIGAPTGADKGAGTLNVAGGYYVNDVAVPTETSTNTLTNKTLTSPVIDTGDINTPDIDGGTADGLTSFGIRSTGAAFDLKLANTEVLTGTKTVTIKVNDTSRTIDLGGNITLAGPLVTSGANSLTLTTTGSTNVTLPPSGTLAAAEADNLFTAGQTITKTNTAAALTAVSTDGSATTFSAIIIDRNSSTPANNDFIGKHIFRGRDDAGNATDYAEIDSQITDTTNGSEDGRLILRTRVNNVMTDHVVISSTDFNYSTGTFTPTVTLVGGAGNTTPVYSTNTGRYTRLGNRVFVDVLLDSDGGNEGAGTGTINIALPVAASASFPQTAFPCGQGRNGTSEYILFGEVSGSTIALAYFDAITNRSALTGAEQNNTTRAIRLSFNYEV